MRVHYYMQFFPGAGAVGTRQPWTLAERFAERGHEVTVLSTDYNLDSGEDEAPFHKVYPAGGSLRVLRVPSPRGGRQSNLERLWSYGHFMFGVGGVGMRQTPPDVVIGSIQPMFTGAAAMAVAKRHGAPFILEVRDLWPDALVVKGAVSPTQAAPMHWMVNRLYHGADRVVSMTPGIKTELLKKGVAADQVDVYPNGFDPALYAGADLDGDAVRRQYGWGDDTVAVYTGSFTHVTACEVYARAAARLVDREDIRFEFFGDGPTREAVMDLAAELGATNVTWRGTVPKIEIPGILAAADVALMALFESPLEHIYFENKFIDYMGAGLPIAAAMRGEQAGILERYQAGRVVAPFDDEGLAAIVSEAANDYAPFEDMGERGRALVRDHLMLPEILDRYVDMVEAVAAGRGDELSAWGPVP